MQRRGSSLSESSGSSPGTGPDHGDGDGDADVEDVKRLLVDCYLASQS